MERDYLHFNFDVEQLEMLLKILDFYNVFHDQHSECDLFFDEDTDLFVYWIIDTIGKYILSLPT